MASGRIKGITIEINGDTTGLQKALAGVDRSLKNTNQSLKDVNKLLKLDPNNVELLQQKQGYLAKAIEDVKSKLETEKRALEQLRNADPSEENAEKQRTLQREIIDTEHALSSYQSEWQQTEQALRDAGRAVDNAGDEMDDLARQADDATDETEDLGESLDDLDPDGAADGFTVLKGALADLVANGIERAISAIGGLLDEAIEATDAMTKFRTTMEFAGFDTAQIDAASAKLKEYADVTVYDLQTIMNTAAQLGANGVQGFDDLTIAAGNLNAAAGGSADTFQSVALVMTQTAGAGKLTTENWRQMMNAIPGAAGVMMQALEDAGAYVGDFQTALSNGEITADEFNAAIMEIGNEPIAVEAASSVSTFEGAMGNLKATIVNGWMEIINTVGQENITGIIQDITELIADAIPIIGEIVSFIVDHKEIVIGVLTGVTAAIMAITVAQWAMNAAMMANPIFLIITLIGALIGVFVALEARFHIFSDFFKESWESIKEVVGGIVEGLKAAFLAAKDAIVNAWEKITGFFSDIWEGIKNVFSAVKDFFVERFMESFELVKGIWSGITGFFSGLWEGIKGIFANVAGWFQSVFEGAKNVVSNIIGAIVSVIKAPINGVISLINVFIRGLNRIRIPSWVPGVGGRGIHISEIPHLARGGVLEKGQIGLLEGSGAEAVVPLENNAAWVHAVAQDMAKALGTNQTINITVNAAPGQSAEAIADAVMLRMQHAVDRKGAVYA